MAASDALLLKQHRQQQVSEGWVVKAGSRQLALHDGHDVRAKALVSNIAVRIPIVAVMRGYRPSCPSKML